MWQDDTLDHRLDLSTSFRPRFHNIRLPVEVCETVIEHAGSPPPLGAFDPCAHYPTLRSCALVCKSWLPRSRCMLYRKVYFRSEAATALFVRTLSEQRFLADVVREIEIEGFHEPWVVSRHPYHKSSYVSFAQGFLLRHLRHMHTLNLYNLDLARDYPPIFPSFVTQYPIRYLTLWNCSLSLSAVFRIIWALDDLHTLTLHHDVHPSDVAVPTAPGPPASFAADCERVQRLSQRRRPKRCQQLRRLVLGAGSVQSRSTLRALTTVTYGQGIFVQSTSFPPPGVFGEHITELYLSLQGGKIKRSRPPFVVHTDPIFGLHPGFVRALPALQLFHISISLAFVQFVQINWTPDDYHRLISSALSALASASSLRIVSFKVSLDFFDPGIPPSRREAARILFYEGMEAHLMAIPPNARIHMVLEDGISPPLSWTGTEYWARFVGEHLPALHDRLYTRTDRLPHVNDQVPEDVPTTPQPGMSEAEAIHVQNRKLWLDYAATIRK